jgi:hypothetical protein
MFITGAVQKLLDSQIKQDPEEQLQAKLLWLERMISFWRTGEIPDEARQQGIETVFRGEDEVRQIGSPEEANGYVEVAISSAEDYSAGLEEE